MIVSAIQGLLADGAESPDTGGMSVDPDDLTPAGIRAAGARSLPTVRPLFPGMLCLPISGMSGHRLRVRQYHRGQRFSILSYQDTCRETDFHVTISYLSATAALRDCRNADIGLRFW